MSRKARERDIPQAQEPTQDARAIASMQRDAANHRRAIADGEERYRAYWLTLEPRERCNFQAPGPA